jgi:monofunctional biosynthetic peptidoglycan transglycosylase
VIIRLLIALPLAAAGALWFWYLALPWPLGLRTAEPGRTAVMEQRLRSARAAGTELEIAHAWVPLDAISPHLRRAVVVAEDGNFHRHRGIDWAALREELRWQGDTTFSIFDADDRRALLAAIAYYRANRDRVRGRSTITQQVAKNLYFGTDRSVVRKVEELLVARRLERFLTKDRILEIYLNIAEWGPGIFGAEAAARRYFSTSAANLTREQAAALAATLPHPLTSNPAYRPARMQWRRDLILSRMDGTGPVPTVPVTPEPEPPTLVPPDTGGRAAPPPDTARPDTLPRDSPRVGPVRRDTLHADSVKVDAVTARTGVS